MRIRLTLVFAGTVALGVLTVTAAALHAHLASNSWNYDDPASAPKRTVGIVLGARAWPGRPSAFLSARLDLAIELLKSGKIERILVSGDGSPASNDEPRVMRDYLISHGVDEALIETDGAGVDTYSTCRRAVDEFGIDSATMISQEYHLPRAITLCRAVGIDAIGVADRTVAERFALIHARAEIREMVARVKMEYDLVRDALR